MKKYKHISIDESEYNDLKRIKKECQAEQDKVDGEKWSMGTVIFMLIAEHDELKQEREKQDERCTI